MNRAFINFNGDLVVTWNDLDRIVRRSRSAGRYAYVTVTETIDGQVSFVCNTNRRNAGRADSWVTGWETFGMKSIADMQAAIRAKGHDPAHYEYDIHRCRYGRRTGQFARARRKHTVTVLEVER